MLNLADNIDDIVKDFSQKKVLVLGDVMLDEYQWCEVSRISPEAPVPVCKITHKTHELGGAGNVAQNIVALGGTVYLGAKLGTDSASETVLDLMKAKSIHSDLICHSASCPTSLKSRIIAKKQQVLRLDEETTEPLDIDLITELMSKINLLINEIDVIILSDYAKGVLNADLSEKVMTLAKKNGIPVLVDPKGNDFSKYKHASYITPNFSEFCDVVGDVTDEKDLIEKAKKLTKKTSLEGLIVTRSEKGITFVDENGTVDHCETKVQDVVDITGAGDTVIATLALAISSKVPMPTAIELANFSAGIVVGKVGAAVAKPKELSRIIKRRNRS